MASSTIKRKNAPGTKLINTSCNVNVTGTGTSGALRDIFVQIGC